MNKLGVTALFLCSNALLLGTPCLPGSLQDYIGLGATGCQEGFVQFNNFGLGARQTGATPIDPNGVQVTPGGTDLSPLLLFSVNRGANAGKRLESIFFFTASGLLTRASIALGSPVVTGDGAVTGILDICPDGAFGGVTPSGCPTAPATAVAFAIAQSTQVSDARTFPVSSFFDVFVDLTADGGIGGSATLGSASVEVASVPEPAAWWLIAAGLAAIGLLRARRAL
jgi:hypothetical protein